MGRSLLLIFFIVFSSTLHAQKDSLSIAHKPVVKRIGTDAGNVSVIIYPVPVRNNYFTVKSDKGMSIIRVTNIIGQDIFKVHYNNPLTIIKINLDNPKRGMYLVTIIFSDGGRIVKKILIEQNE